MSSSAEQMAINDNLARVRADAVPSAPFPSQRAWLKRFNKLLPQTQGLRPVRIAVMGNGTLNLLASALRLWLGLEGYAAEIYLCSYGAWRQEILDPGSAFYLFQPDVVWILSTERDLDFRQIDPGADSATCRSAVTDAAEDCRSFWNHVQSRCPARIVQCNFEDPPLRVFGHYEATVPWSRTSLIRDLNQTLGDLARQQQVTIFDLHYVAASFGLARWREERQWHQSKLPFSPNAFGLVAFNFARLVAPMLGSVRKCIVVDLDNTLWGGVIGDEGVDGIRLGDGAEGEAFVAFQAYLKRLLQRGILLAVCSKNEQSAAEEPFRKHPAMRIQLGDISAFCANWENKADNLRRIAASLNIGLDSLVFVDDNPAERALVKSQLPEVTVVDLPEDPSDYPAAVDAGCFFETRSYSSEDAMRVQLYRENALRGSAMQSASDLDSFLRDLHMHAESGPLDSFRLPRMAQLLGKTNQFHLTTTRYSEAELVALAQDPHNWVRWFSLRDRIGDHGLISVAILRPGPDALVIDTWAMSCRVFSRGMEDFIFLEMLAAARTAGVRRLIGHYKPTAKNHPVAGLYEKLGFNCEGMDGDASRWILDVDPFVPQSTPFIAKASKSEDLILA